MRKFLAGDRFQSYAEAFARPSARSWLPFVIEGEVAAVADSSFALRQIVGIPRTAKVGEFLQKWNSRGRRRGAQFHVAGFDPTAWELVDLCVWQEKPALEWKSDLYQLARVSIGDPSTPRTPSSPGNNRTRGVGTFAAEKDLAGAAAFQLTAMTALTTI